MNPKITLSVTLGAVFLIGIVGGFLTSRRVGIIGRQGEVNLAGVDRYQIEAAPFIKAELMKTGYGEFWVTITAADKSRIGVVCDKNGVVNTYRTITDGVTDRLILDKNADGVPEFIKTKDLKTGSTKVESLKIILEDKNVGSGVGAK